MGNCGAGEAFLSLFYVKMSGFKLNFESQFDILYAIFCFNLAYTGARAGIQRKKKGNDQDLTKYLINDCSSAGLCVLVYGLQTVLSLAQSVPWAQKNGHRVACASAETVQCVRSQNS